MDGATERLLDVLFAELPVGLALVGADLRYQRVNAVLAEINGIAPADHAGRRVDEILGDLGGHLEVLLRRVLETQAPVRSIPIEAATPADPDARRTFSATCLPVAAPDGALGVLGFVTEATRERSALRERDRLLKDALTARAHAEAAQARSEAAHAEAEEERRRLAFLADAGPRLAQSIRTGTTLQEVAEIVVPGLADWCAITLVREDGRLEHVAVAHADPAKLALVEEFGARYPPRADAPAGAPLVIRTGEPQILTELPPELIAAVAQDAEHEQMLRDLGLRSALVMPLTTPDGTIGALSLVRAGARRPFAHGDVRLAEALASRAALHISNARLYAERSHIAETLQASLLAARLPEIPGAQLAARYAAAGAANAVGGDFYDAFRTEDGDWTLVIGDVTGKGPEAAAQTAVVRHAVRLASEYHRHPDEVLWVVNRVLRQEQTGRFCTIALVRLGLSDGGVDGVVVLGGHPAPLVLRADGSVERVGATGTLVGALEHVELEAVPLRLERDDVLLLFTDGLVELRGMDAARGERWLPAAVAARAGCPPDTMLDELIEEARALQGGIARDDMALLALRVCP